MRNPQGGGRAAPAQPESQRTEEGERGGSGGSWSAAPGGGPGRGWLRKEAGEP